MERHWTGAKSTRKPLKDPFPQLYQADLSPRLDEFFDANLCQKSFRDFEDPGSQVPLGTDAHTALNEREALGRSNTRSPIHCHAAETARQRAVARVVLTQRHLGLLPGSGWGSGFLVSPSLFITNHHVIDSATFASRVTIEFGEQGDFLGNAQPVARYLLDPDALFYTNALLDFTLIRLPEKLKRACPGPVREFIPLGDSLTYALRQQVNILRHPRERRKEIGLQRTQLTHIFSTRLRYQTETAPIPSGSPVFNTAWDLIALHQATGEQESGTWVNNQAVRIDKVVADLRTHFRNVPDGSRILAELGL